MEWKDWLKMIGLGGLLGVGSVLAVVLLVGAWILAIAGPVILVAWAVQKLFF